MPGSAYLGALKHEGQQLLPLRGLSCCTACQLCHSVTHLHIPLSAAAKPHHGSTNRLLRACAAVRFAGLEVPPCPPGQFVELSLIRMPLPRSWGYDISALQSRAADGAVEP